MSKIIPLKQKSDAELIQDYKDGKADISILYNRYARLVYGSCLKHFKNKADADDAVSEIFSLISKKLKTHEVKSFKSWLYTVTRNYCIEILRKNNRQRDKISTAESMYSETIFHPDNVEDEQMIYKLSKCMEALPPKQKQSIDLFYYQKMGYKEIAQRLDISWDKVRSFIQNGRRNLKNCIEKK